MAKRRYRRYRRRSGRWAPNIVKVSNQIAATAGEFFASEDLAVNPVQTTTGVSQTFTIKNLELNFTIEAPYNSLQALSSITAYIMYVPQGMNITAGYYAEHPEYIMAYKYLGSPDGLDPVSTGSGITSFYKRQNYQPFRVRTRLSRKLQTGDKVILYIQGSAETAQNFNIDGLVRWWSKAN